MESEGTPLHLMASAEVQQDRDSIIHQVEHNAHAADRVQAHAAGRIRPRDHLLWQGVCRDIPAWRKAQEL